MLLDHLPTMAIAAATAPGSVVAPAWLLPMAATMMATVPAAMIPLLKGAENDEKEWKQSAPLASECYLASHPDAFVVLDAGDKGKGLFCTCHVPKGTYLFDYAGELLSQAEYDARYPNQVSDYAAALRTHDGSMRFIDAQNEECMLIEECTLVDGAEACSLVSHCSPARWMNHDDRTPNVGRRSFHPSDSATPRILMYTLVDLQPGDEMQWDYGKGYWAAHSGKVDSA